jgi:hypothetical protein
VSKGQAYLGCLRHRPPTVANSCHLLLDAFMELPHYPSSRGGVLPHRHLCDPQVPFKVPRAICVLALVIWLLLNGPGLHSLAR